MSRYQAFLSHNSADKPAVEELARRLEKAGISTFLDIWHLIPGEPCQLALEEALDQSKTCVVFIGPSGLGPWQNEEMRAAISQRVGDPGREFRVIPVLLPGAQREQRSKLPPFLVAATWVEFSRGTLDDDGAFHRLTCGVRGHRPGFEPGQSLYEGECPYRGLEAFDTEDTRFFFGRDAQVDWMLERLGKDFETIHENRFLGVIGASGSGKSSVVRAGLIPAILSGQSRSGKGVRGSAEWPVAILRPGEDPLLSLAWALNGQAASKAAVPDVLAFHAQLLQDSRRLHAAIGVALHGTPDDRRFVLVVDQFEELFTQCPRGADTVRQAFIDNVLYAATVRGGRCLVIITMRADFYGRCSRYERLAHALSDDQELVPPLANDDLRAAIEQPAMLCGMEFEPGLVDLLLRDMSLQSAGALPLLQQTLLLLWERRKGPRLTISAYNQIGKIEGALEVYAESIHSQELRSDAQRDLCRRIFLLLVSPSEGAAYIRRRVPVTHLGTGSDMDQVVQTLVKRRLLTVAKTSPPLIEVTHEALIRGWRRVQNWLKDDPYSHQLLQYLTAVAHEWESAGRKSDTGLLLTKGKLAEVARWADSHQAELADMPVARDFLKESIEQEEKTRQAELDLLRRVAESENAAKVRLRWILAVTAAVAVLSLFLAGSYRNQLRDARANELAAQLDAQLRSGCGEWTEDRATEVKRQLDELASLNSVLLDSSRKRTIESLESCLGSQEHARTPQQYARYEALRRMIERMGGERTLLLEEQVPLAAHPKDLLSAVDPRLLDPPYFILHPKPPENSKSAPLYRKFLDLTTLSPLAANASLGDASVVEVTFDDSWNNASELAVEHWTTLDNALIFRLGAIPERHSRKGSPLLRERNVEGGAVSMQILLQDYDDTIVLAERPITLRPGPLTFLVKRVNARLEFEVRTSESVKMGFHILQPIRFDERLSMRCPSNVGILNTQVYGFFNRPPDPFSEADQLFVAGEFAAAESAYAKLSETYVDNNDLRREALLKQAITIVTSTRKHTDTLDSICSRLLADKAGAAESKWWRAAAAAQRLYAMALEQNRSRDRDPDLVKAIEEIRKEFTLEELIQVVPLSQRREIVGSLFHSWGFDDAFYMLEAIPNRSDMLEQMISLLPMIDADEYQVLMQRWRLVDAYHFEASRLEAKQNVTEADSWFNRTIKEMEQVLLGAHDLREHRKLLDGELASMCRDYIWLLIRKERFAEALERISVWQRTWFHNSPTSLGLMEIEKARIEGAKARLEGTRKNWEAADLAIVEFFEGFKRGAYRKSDFTYSEYAEACLIRGLVSQKLNRPGIEVQQYLNDGRYCNRAVDFKKTAYLDPRRSGKEMRESGRANFTASAVSGIAQQLTKEEVSALTNDLLYNIQTESAIYNLIRIHLDRMFPSEYLHRLILDGWSDEAGREVILRRVFGSMSFYDYNADPLAVTAVAGVRVELEPGDLPKSLQDRLFLEIKQLVVLFTDGHLNEEDGGNILSAWYGVMQRGAEGVGKRQLPDGWRSTREKLESLVEAGLVSKDLPGYVAYLFGCRTLRKSPNANEDDARRWNYENARTLLQYAVEKTDADSELGRLAKERLEEVSKAMTSQTRSIPDT